MPLSSSQRPAGGTLRAQALRGISPDSLFEILGDELKDAPGPRDLLIYLHVPFCSSKCHFCDFVADLDVPDLLSGSSIRGDYVSALCRQISSYGPRLHDLGYRPRLVYWGGGTPSRLAPEELERVISTLAESFDLSGVQEHSFESSPETLTEEKVARLRGAGVDRVSIGVQSFVEQELRRAGRAHSAVQAIEAAQAVRSGGIENFNLDLIACMPGQSLADLRLSLETCASLQPAHVTVYIYRADPRTVMAKQIGRGDRHSVRLAHMLESFQLCQRVLTEAGYTEYVLGHFARDKESRFLGESYYFDLAGDLIDAGDFIGFGSGAGSTLGHYSLSNSHRTFHRYREDPLTIECCERYSPQNIGIISRELRLAMLTWNGIDRQRFERLFGYPLTALGDQPLFGDYLSYFRLCGAQIVEDDRGLRVTEATKLRAHLRSYVATTGYVRGARARAADPGPAP